MEMLSFMGTEALGSVATFVLAILPRFVAVRTRCLSMGMGSFHLLKVLHRLFQVTEIGSPSNVGSEYRQVEPV